MKGLYQHQRHNLTELVAVLRTFPMVTEFRESAMLGHYLGVAYMVLVQRRVVIDALQNYLDEDLKASA